jgi:hypothetical protein
MDQKELLGFVQANLGAPPNQINNALQIENATDHLIETINQGIAASTPWAKPCEFSNPDFTPECREAVHNTRRLRRTYKATREPADWERYSEARNHKKHTVSKALRQGHRQRVAEATEDPRGLWKIHKWARNRSNFDQGRTPTIEFEGNQITNPEGKAEAFQKVFFPTPPEPDLSDISYRYLYYPDVDFPDIQPHEVEEAIRHAPAGKAAGDDAIPNETLHALIPALVPYFTPIFNACMKLGFNPSHFQKSVTVVLRKLGNNRKYTEPKSYRPVALLNTIGKH